MTIETAMLCLDCGELGESRTICNTCGSRSLWPLDLWLNRRAPVQQRMIIVPFYEKPEYVNAFSKR